MYSMLDVLAVVTGRCHLRRRGRLGDFCHDSTTCAPGTSKLLRNCSYSTPVASKCWCATFVCGRTNNGVENFHNQLKTRVKVSHPNLFVILDHLRNLSVDLMLEVSRQRQHSRIRRTPRRHQKNNDKRIRDSMEENDSGRYSKLEFLSAVL